MENLVGHRRHRQVEDDLGPDVFQQLLQYVLNDACCRAPVPGGGCAGAGAAVCCGAGSVSGASSLREPEGVSCPREHPLAGQGGGSVPAPR